jgi:hypothetical protein
MQALVRTYCRHEFVWNLLSTVLGTAIDIDPKPDSSVILTMSAAGICG